METRGRANNERNGIILRWTLTLVIAVTTLLSFPAQSRADGALARRVAHLRHGVEWQRTATWDWQRSAGVPHTPTNHAERSTRSILYLRWIVHRWNKRRLHAKHFAVAIRNRGTVPQIICRVFTGGLCSIATAIAWRESRYEITAWNSSDHGGLFQLGTGERATYATIGYATAYQQTVAAHNLYLARGWEPWTCCE